MMNVSELLAQSALPKLIGSAVLVALVWSLRTFLARGLLRHTANIELRRRWIVSLRNVLILVLLVGLSAIWIDELRTFAAALVAVAVATVLATKEFILCLNGSILRTATNAYSVGDRIEIGGHRGDVVDFNFLSTTLLEVGPGRGYHLRTGRTILIPNSMLLNTHVVNESAMGKIVLHVFPVPLEPARDWERAERLLLEAAEEECAPLIDEARRQMSHLEQEHGLGGPPVRARVHVQIPAPGTLTLLVRVPAVVGREGQVEQAILRRFLQQFTAAPGASDDVMAGNSQNADETSHSQV